MTPQPTEPQFNIIVDDLNGPEIVALLRSHLAFANTNSPLGSVHALDLEALKQDNITFWSAWQGSQLVGCIALKELDDGHGEIKSMHTIKTSRRNGVARRLLMHLMDEAQARSYRRLSLETGGNDAFAPARRLYESFGFEYCPPFGNYVDDSFSNCMTRTI